MISAAQFEFEISQIITNALREDVGEGDHSALACIPANATGKVQLLVKDAGVIAGVAFAEKVFKTLDPDVDFETIIKDGENVEYGDVAFYVSGRVHDLLKAERLILNAMQRMSAISTKTRMFVKQLEKTNTKILDTRKTTPGLRALEKWAVKIGGGENHRFALYDMIMLKDNHIDFCGSIGNAIKKTLKYLETEKKELKIIVEARNMREVEEIIEYDGVYRILLDNFSPAQTKEAVSYIGKRCLTESSGGITLDNLTDYAACGVNYISSGALTHSVHNMDLSLKAV